MIDDLLNYTEAVPGITASAEETSDQYAEETSDQYVETSDQSSDHLINTWIARRCCLMTFQSENETAFVGEVTRELMRRSQVA